MDVHTDSFVLDISVDCPGCGVTPKRRKFLTLKGLDATPLILKAPYLCEECGSRRAFLVLKRQPRMLH